MATVKTLRSRCEAMGIDSTGTKPVLEARLAKVAELVNGTEGAAPAATTAKLPSPVVIRDENGNVLTQAMRIGARVKFADTDEDGATRPSKRDSNVPRTHKSLPLPVALALPRYADEIAALAE